MLSAGWPSDTPVCVVSRAGWPDQRASDHGLGELGHAALLHAGRPTVVTVGVGAQALPKPTKTLAPERAQAMVETLNR